jgi:hypothetical protein
MRYVLALVTSIVVAGLYIAPLEAYAFSSGGAKPTVARTPMVGGSGSETVDRTNEIMQTDTATSKSPACTIANTTNCKIVNGVSTCADTCIASRKGIPSNYPNTVYSDTAIKGAVCPANYQLKGIAKTGPEYEFIPTTEVHTSNEMTMAQYNTYKARGYSCGWAMTCDYCEWQVDPPLTAIYTSNFNNCQVGRVFALNGTTGINLIVLGIRVNSGMQFANGNTYYPLIGSGLSRRCEVKLAAQDCVRYGQRLYKTNNYVPTSLLCSRVKQEWQ